MVMEAKKVRFMEPLTDESSPPSDLYGIVKYHMKKNVAHSEGTDSQQTTVTSENECQMAPSSSVSGKALSLPLPMLASSNDLHGIDSKQMHQDYDDADSRRQPLRFLANSVSISVNSRNQETKETESQCSRACGEEKKHSSLVTYVSKGVSCVDDFEAEQRAAMIVTTLLKDFFQFWRWHSKKRHWKKIVQLRDEQICFLMQKLEGATSRPLVYCRRQRMRRVMNYWAIYCIQKNRTRQLSHKAEAFHLRNSTARLFQIWRRESKESLLEKIQERRSLNKRKNSIIYKCIRVLRESARRPQIEPYQYERAECMRRQRIVWLPLCVLRYNNKLRESERSLHGKMNFKMLQNMLRGWWKETQSCMHWARMEARASRRYTTCILAKAFYGWCGYVDGNEFKTLLEQSIFAIHAIEQLYDDNTRLAKIVDAGAWGDQQIDLIHSATHALQEEKETLKKILNQFPWARDRRISSKSVQRHRNSAEKISSCPDVFLRLSRPMESPNQKPASKSNEETIPNPTVFQCKAMHPEESTEQMWGPHGTSKQSLLRTVIPPLDSVPFTHTVRKVKEKFKSMGYIRASTLLS